MSHESPGAVLELIHAPGSAPYTFRARLVTPTGEVREREEVTLASPASVVLGTAGPQLLAELHWYLEDYLESAVGANLARARRVQSGLQDWASVLIVQLAAAGFEIAALASTFGQLRIAVCSEDNRVLAWPWEAIGRTSDGWFAEQCRFERRTAASAGPSRSIEGHRIGILAVIARPYERDVAYRHVFYPVLERIRTLGYAVDIRVLRPPTFAQLELELARHPGATQILHFDGHGRADGEDGVDSGQLIFETEKIGIADAVDAHTLGRVLVRHGVTLAVLGACRSAAAVNKGGKRPASIASDLLQAGVPSVVAMTHSLYANAAALFMPAFYNALLGHGSVSDATHAGRLALLNQPYREKDLRLDDWLVPVAFGDSDVRPSVQPSRDTSPSAPPEAQPSQLALQLIGRNREILFLERALRQPAAVTLVHGLPGSGKTALVRAYVDWLGATGGLTDQVHWLSGDIDRIVSSLREVALGSKRGLLDRLLNRPGRARTLRSLLRALARRPMIIVVDELLDVPDESKTMLSRCLQVLTGRRCKFLVVSDGSAPWLSTCVRLRVGEMSHDERSKLTDALYATSKYRESDAPSPDPGMEVINSTAADERGDGEAGRNAIAAMQALQFRLPAELDELRYPIMMLHENFVATEFLQSMCAKADYALTQPQLMDALERLENAGVLTAWGNGIYERRDVLWVGPNSANNIPENRKVAWEKAFFLVHAEIASQLINAGLQVQASVAPMIANFSRARVIAKAKDDFDAYAVLTQFFLEFSSNRGRFDQVRTLAEEQMAWHELHGRDTVAARLALVAALRCETHLTEAANVLDTMLGDASLATNSKLGASYAFEAGSLKCALGDPDTALQHFETARRLDGEATSLSAYAWLASGAIEIERNADVAKNYLQRALDAFYAEQNEGGILKAHLRLGELAAGQDDADTAADHFAQALDHSDEGNVHSAAACAYALGRLALDQGKFADAEGWARWLLQLSHEHPLAAPTMRPYAAWLLASVAFSVGDRDLARDWYAYLASYDGLDEASVSLARSQLEAMRAPT